MKESQSDAIFQEAMHHLRFEGRNQFVSCLRQLADIAENGGLLPNMRNDWNQIACIRAADHYYKAQFEIESLIILGYIDD